MGELFAWIIGWDLVLEYAVGAATVANGWSSYFVAMLKNFGWQLPASIASTPLVYDDVNHVFKTTEAFINLPALVIVTIVTIILVKGIQESAGFNALMVLIKVAAVLFVICVGAFYVNPDNWKPLAPFGWSGLSLFGIPIAGETREGAPVGMLAGAAIIFFAYIGFDSVSTHAEEAKRPQRDVPIGIIASLVICTVLYVGVVAVLTGMVPYHQIDTKAGVSDAFKHVGLAKAELLIAAAGVAGITSVLLVMMLSAPRVFLAMARDGLVPKKFFADVHPRFRTPWKSTILIDYLLHLTNIGTLFAFVIVCAAVLIMRKTHPNAERPFRCPMVPLVPILGIGCCLMLMLSLPVENWYRLFIWLGIGLVIYYVYGRRHSVLGKELQQELGAHGVSPAGSPRPPLKQ
jgi:APA family basic amino acid/polyamine antiporter